MSTVKKDDISIYVVSDGCKFRPKNVRGYDALLDQGDAGLRKGDKVKTKKLPNQPLLELYIDNVVYTWCSEKEIEFVDKLYKEHT